MDFPIAGSMVEDSCHEPPLDDRAVEADVVAVSLRARDIGAATDVDLRAPIRVEAATDGRTWAAPFSIDQACARVPTATPRGTTDRCRPRRQRRPRRPIRHRVG